MRCRDKIFSNFMLFLVVLKLDKKHSNKSINIGDAANGVIKEFLKIYYSKDIN